MYITIHRAGPPLFVKLRTEHCIVLSPRISLCRVCNRHVIGSAGLRGNHPIIGQKFEHRQVRGAEREEIFGL